MRKLAEGQNSLFVTKLTTLLPILYIFFIPIYKKGWPKFNISAHPKKFLKTIFTL